MTNLTNKNFNAVSELQYLLQKLASEAGELAHAVNKTLEFGLDNPDPTDNEPMLKIINREYNDVLACADALRQIGLELYRDNELIADKTKRLVRFQDLAVKRGLVDPETVIPAEGRVNKVKELLTKILADSKVSLKEDMNEDEVDHLYFTCLAYPEILFTIKHCVDNVPDLFPDYTFQLSYAHDPESSRLGHISFVGRDDGTKTAEQLCEDYDKLVEWFVGQPEKLTSSNFHINLS